MQLMYHSERDFHLTSPAENVSVNLQRLWLPLYSECRCPFNTNFLACDCSFFITSALNLLSHASFCNFDHPFVFHFVQNSGPPRSPRLSSEFGKSLSMATQEPPNRKRPLLLT